MAQTQTQTQTQTPGFIARGKYGFAHAPTAAQTLPLLRDHWKAAGVKRVFAFFSDNALAQFLAPLTQDAAREAGIEYGEALFKLGETDYRGVAARAKDFNPGAILIYSQATPDDGLLIKQLRELGVNASLSYGFNAYDVKTWRDAVGEYVEGMVFAGVFLQWNGPTSREFIEAYRAKVGRDPGENESESYDIIKMFAYRSSAPSYASNPGTPTKAPTLS